MDPSSSAANKLFNIYKLVDIIFEDFIATDLLRLQRINRTTHAVVWGSQDSKQALFIEHGTTDQCLYREKWLRTPSSASIVHSPFFPGPRGLFSNIIDSVPQVRSFNRTLWPPRILFANKTQSRAVLLKDRPKYSYERMFPVFPKPNAFEVRYLAAEDIAIERGDEELTWITQKTVHIAALGKIITLAARIVVEDDEAWDSEEPLLAVEGIKVSATTYLKFFQHRVSATAELDFHYESYPRSTTKITPKQQRLLIVRTWPWSLQLQSALQKVEEEWLRASGRTTMQRPLRLEDEDSTPYLKPKWAGRLNVEKWRLFRG